MRTVQSVIRESRDAMAKAVTDTKGLPDLVVSLRDIKVPTISESRASGTCCQQSGYKRNQEPLDINLYASTDSVLNSNDELLVRTVMD